MEEKKKILVVDDDIAHVKLIAHHLDSAGYEVSTAHDGEEGLRKAVEVKPHLMILDMNMPKLKGAGVFRAIMGADGRLQFPTLILTAAADLEMIYKDLKVDGFMSKPFDINQLLFKVRMILADRFGEGIKKRVLMIGPEEYLVARMKEHLESLHYSVFVCTNDEHSLEETKASKPDAVVYQIKHEEHFEAVNRYTGLLKKLPGGTDVMLVVVAPVKLATSAVQILKPLPVLAYQETTDLKDTVADYLRKQFVAV